MGSPRQNKTEKKQTKLNPFRRDYILEELALLTGCCTLGMTDTNVKDEFKHENKSPFFLAYPGIEENAFKEGQIILEKYIDKNKLRQKYEFNWLPLKLAEDANEQCYATFNQDTLLKKLLDEKNSIKKLAILISIKKEFDDIDLINGKLAALVNLLSMTIDGASSLAKKETASLFTLDIFIADTLQAYNAVDKKTQDLENEIKKAQQSYKIIGQQWHEHAQEKFALIQHKCKINFWFWDDLISKARSQNIYGESPYYYNEFYTLLVEKYESSSQEPAIIKFQAAIDSKGEGKIAREMSKNSQETAPSKLAKIEQTTITQKIKKELIGFNFSAQETEKKYPGYHKNQHWIINCFTKGLDNTVEPPPFDINNIKENNSYTVITTEGDLNKSTDYFVKRNILFADLNKAFKEQPIVCCHGRNGIGKTAMALAYIASEASSNYHQKIWLESDNPLTSFKKLGAWFELIKSGNVSAKNKIQSQIKEWLAKQKEKILLIVDFKDSNVSSKTLQEISEYTPDNCHVLLIARKPIPLLDKRKVALISMQTGFSEKETIEYFDKCFSQDKFTEQEYKHLLELANYEDYLPISLSKIVAELNNTVSDKKNFLAEQVKLRAAQESFAMSFYKLFNIPTITTIEEKNIPEIHRFPVDFLKKYLSNNKPVLVHPQADGNENQLSLVGFGAALAVGKLIGDVDCIEGIGSGLGYIIVEETNSNKEKIAKTIKISTRSAFASLKQSKAQMIGKSSPINYSQLHQLDQEEYKAAAKLIIKTSLEKISQCTQDTLAKKIITHDQAKSLLEDFLGFKKMISQAFSLSSSYQVVLSQDKQFYLLHFLEKNHHPYQENTIIHPTTTIQDTDENNAEHINSEFKQSSSDQKDIFIFQQPYVTEHFIKQEKLLTALEKNLQTDTKTIISQLIGGLGGVGKTQLAAYYMHLSIQRKSYDAIIWLYAEQNLDIQLEELVAGWSKEKFSDKKQLKTELYNKLSNKRVLIIFDNAVKSQKEIIEQLFFNLRPHILITSREPGWSINELTLRGFNPEEGKAYIKKQLPDAKNDEMTALLETTTHLPLALAHAVTYIKKGYCQLLDYPQHFATHQLNFAKIPATYIESSETVATTFLMVLFRLAKEYPVVEDIVKVCALLASDNIPKRLLDAILIKNNHPQKKYLSLKEDEVSKYSGEEIFQGIKLLEQNSLLAAPHNHLLHTDPKDYHYSMHRLIQQATQSWYYNSEYNNNSLIIQLKLLATILASEFKQSNWDDTLPKKNRYLLDKYPYFLHPHLEIIVKKIDLLAIHSEKLKPELGALLSILSVTSILSLDEYFLAPQQIADKRRIASKYAERSLIIQQDLYGEHHLETAKALYNFARTLPTNEKKRALLIQTLSIQENLFGKNHMNTLDSLNELAQIYFLNNDFFKSCNLFEQVYGLQKKKYGICNRNTLKTMSTLLFTYAKINKHTKCEPLEQKLALKIEQLSISRPPSYYETAEASYNLAIIYGDLGYLNKKCMLLEQAIALQEEFPEFQSFYLLTLWYVQKPPATAEIKKYRDCLALTYDQLGKLEKKYCFFKQAFNIRKKHCYLKYGLNIVNDSYNLAIIETSLGNAEKKCIVLDKKLKSLKEKLGNDHRRLVNPLRRLAMSQGHLGNNRLKCHLLKEALRIKEKYYNKLHVKIIYDLWFLARSYNDLDKHTEKYILLEQLFNILEKARIVSYLTSVNTLMQIKISFYNDIDRIDAMNEKELELLIKIYRIKEKYPDPKHILVARSKIVARYCQLGKKNKAIAFKQEIIANEKRYAREFDRTITVVNSRLDTKKARHEIIEESDKLKKETNYVKADIPLYGNSIFNHAITFAAEAQHVLDKWELHQQQGQQ